MPTTKIAYVDHTHNPWHGCQKVSAGCANCYAEPIARRFAQGVNCWGPDSARIPASKRTWRQPLFWNGAAARAGERRRVLCMSMGDLFEQRPDLTDGRFRTFELIESTPWLDWPLLTKRPEYIDVSIPQRWRIPGWPPNAWMGVSCEDQRALDERVPYLLRCGACLHWLSLEPLLERIDLGWIKRIAWVVIGCESGAKRRPCKLEWVRSAIEQCDAAGVPAFVKQLSLLDAYRKGRVSHDPAEWPVWARRREFPK